MGQTMGRMPETWTGILEERDRVLHWSSEVLARVQDNVTNEDTFLMDYDDDKIDNKIEIWIKTNQTQVEETFKKFPNASLSLKNVVNAGIEKISEEIRTKMRKDYQQAYSDIKKFNKKVDELGANERKLHAEIQSLEEECAGDTKKFQKKFGPLRLKVFDNLRTGEKMIFKDKRLKSDFTKRIYDIDHKHSAECVKQIDKLLKDFEKNVAKEET
ncbi:uncharacterized protein LOC105195451 isoform X2 [Solenopsis invicta]|uniref:uncharacterized protein LOC105195451 isoform X2 n=1 Tax=Solenopsis invicta TaxID=13686 RepID=UPI000595F7E2|nr:uncharacterized protein LOC105195451 isoform X2 [Solenopsis invicta]